MNGNWYPWSAAQGTNRRPIMCACGNISKVYSPTKVWNARICNGSGALMLQMWGTIKPSRYKKTDQAVFGGDRGDSTFVNNGKTYKTYSACKLAIRDRSWISANTKNPRLITDAEFTGL